MSFLNIDHRGDIPNFIDIPLEHNNNPTLETEMELFLKEKKLFEIEKERFYAEKKQFYSQLTQLEQSQITQLEQTKINLIKQSDIRALSTAVNSSFRAHNMSVEGIVDEQTKKNIYLAKTLLENQLEIRAVNDKKEKNLINFENKIAIQNANLQNEKAIFEEAHNKFVIELESFSQREKSLEQRFKQVRALFMAPELDETSQVDLKVYLGQNKEQTIFLLQFLLRWVQSFELFKFVYELSYEWIDVNKVYNGYTFTLLAMKHLVDPLDCLKYLVQKGIGINFVGVYLDLRSPFHFEIVSKKTNLFNLIKYLVEEHQCDLNRPDQFNSKPIRYFCGNINNVDMDLLEYVLEKSTADYRPKNTDRGMTLIHHAMDSYTDKGDIKVIQHLCNQQGVNLAAVNANNYTCIDQAFLKNISTKLPLIRFIVDGKLIKFSKHSQTYLIHLCEEKSINFDAIRYICEGTDIIKYDFVDNNEQTALHHLLTPGKTNADLELSRVVQYLIKKGVPLNIIDDWSETPLDKVDRDCFPLVYSVLIDHGAKFAVNLTR
jgi:hypothetical protein